MNHHQRSTARKQRPQEHFHPRNVNGYWSAMIRRELALAGIDNNGQPKYPPAAAYAARRQTQGAAA